MSKEHIAALCRANMELSTTESLFLSLVEYSSHTKLFITENNNENYKKYNSTLKRQDGFITFRLIQHKKLPQGGKEQTLQTTFVNSKKNYLNETK